MYSLFKKTKISLTEFSINIGYRRSYVSQLSLVDEAESALLITIVSSQDQIIDEANSNPLDSCKKKKEQNAILIVC